MKGQSTQVAKRARIRCRECARRYRINSNPHAEGMKYCPGCGSNNIAVQYQYVANNENGSRGDLADFYSDASIVLRRDRVKLF